MSTARPFSYNTGSTISGTIQIGNLAIGYPDAGFESTGLEWWNGPDEDLGYVIAQQVPDNSQPTPVSGKTASVGFFRSETKTESSFINLTNSLFNQTFTTGDECKTYLNNNGYWTSWIVSTPTPTPTPTSTPTPTPTETPTPNIVTSGLVIQLDAYESSSYPGTGTTVFDITGGYDHTLIGASYTVLNGIKCFDCTTGNNRVNYNLTGPTLPNSGYTYITWARLISSNSVFRTLLYTSGPPKITPITIPNASNTLGYWATAFVSSGYNVASSAGVWVQFAVVGTNTSQTFYINGSQVGSTINEGAGGTKHWGWGNNDTVAQPWGHVANMYFYNRQLSLSEITQQYNYLAPRFVEPTPTPTSTATPTPTPTPTPTETPTPTPTPTITPTISPTPTSSPIPSSAVTFSQTFTSGVSPGTTIENAWTTFRGQLTGTYTKFDFTSSNGQGYTGVTDPVKVQQLADSLRTGTTGVNFSTVINGVTWLVGCCACRQGGALNGAVEFANVGLCSPSSTASLRPFINNLNWGGIGSTVGAATQTLTLKFY
jgi:hypothetical protein